MNDPNGPFRWRGRWHLFFQHNPAGPVHGAICWGHATSGDLARWTFEPVALTPTAQGPDAAGCWSGCVVDDGGLVTAVYTGLADEDPLSATVCLAYAQDDDLRDWQPDPDPVAFPPEGREWTGFRDPYVLTLGGHRYAVVGAGSADRGAAVLLYGFDDLRRWTYLGPLLAVDDPVAAAVAPADIWECPQLARIDDQWVLVVSLVAGGGLGRVAYLLGELVAEGAGFRFAPTGGGLVDHGHDFYAPALWAEDGRVLLWGWTWEDRAVEEVLGSGWAGALTFPRTLRVRAGVLVSSPAPEVDRLRLASTDVALGTDHRDLALPAGPVDLALTLSASGPVTLRLEGSGHDLTVALDPAVGTVRLERDVHERYRRTWATEGTFPPAPERLALRLLVDGSVVELHVADGPTFTERSYPSYDGPKRLRVTGTGTFQAEGAVHRLG